MQKESWTEFEQAFNGLQGKTKPTLFAAGKRMKDGRPTFTVTLRHGTKIITAEAMFATGFTGTLMLPPFCAKELEIKSEATSKEEQKNLYHYVCDLKSTTEASVSVCFSDAGGKTKEITQIVKPWIGCGPDLTHRKAKANETVAAYQVDHYPRIILGNAYAYAAKLGYLSMGNKAHYFWQD